MMSDEDHKCFHEKEITIWVDRSEDMARDLHKLLDMMQGNEERDGILTKMALTNNCLKKLHKRVDRFEAMVEAVNEKAAICEANALAIKRIIFAMKWFMTPMFGAMCVGLIKMIFFGG